MQLNSIILSKNESSNNIDNRKNLINPLMIYGVPKIVNKNEKNNFDIPNFNMIDSSKKGKVNYPMFSFPNIEKFNLNNIITTEVENKNGIEADLEDTTLSIEKTFSFPNKLNKDCETKLKEISNKDNKIENIEFLNKKRKANKKEVQYLDSDSKIKKIRMIILNSIINFINKKIKLLFNNDLGKGILKKQFLPINKTILYHSSVEYDKEFLNKKLKEILSLISEKYTNYLSTKNKDLIEYLINSEDKGKSFKELFELSFLDCLEHIRGTKYVELLNGLPKMDDILIQEKNFNEDEIKIYKDIINNYEKIIEYKKKRNAKKPRNRKNINFIVN